MILVVAATDIEMAPFQKSFGGEAVKTLVTGVGLVEAAITTARALVENQGQVEAVVNLGVAGAYIGSGPEILDICLATDEVIGDLGICHEMGVEPFNPEKIPVVHSISLDAGLLKKAGGLLDELQEKYRQGRFVSVNCVSATAARGALLFQAYSAICENMEGAAIARGCQKFAVPCLEIRCISNMVEDRNLANWQLEEACLKIGSVAAELVAGLQGVKG